MDQSALKTDDTNVIFQQWRFKDEAEIEHKRQSLREEKSKFEEERRKLEREIREFSIHKRIEAQRAEKEKQLFQMKFRILEEELRKLAHERQQVAKQRDFYRYVSAYEKHEEPKKETNIVPGDMFFVGVENEQSLKRRYKELIKIYHPDNLDGDTGTLQEINREYDRLRRIYE